MRWISVGHGVDGCCKFKVPPFFIVIKVVTDLRVIIVVVGIFPGCLDKINVQTFCNICGPLMECTRPHDSWDDGLEKLKFGDLEVRDHISALPNMKRQVEDDILEPVEQLEGLHDVVEDVSIEIMELGKVSKVEEGVNTDNKLWVNTICDQSKDIPLDVLMLTAGYLL